MVNRRNHNILPPSCCAVYGAIDNIIPSGYFMQRRECDVLCATTKVGHLWSSPDFEPANHAPSMKPAYLFPRWIYFDCGSFHYAALLMLSKCLNPDCPATFRYLKEGRLFRVHLRHKSLPPEDAANSATPSRRHMHVEHFWLCQECSHRFAVTVGEHGEVHLLPHKPAAAAPLPASTHSDAQETSAG